MEKSYEIREKVIKGLDLSYKKLIQDKKINNRELVVSENGKIIRLKAQEIECE